MFGANYFAQPYLAGVALPGNTPISGKRFILSTTFSKRKKANAGFVKEQVEVSNITSKETSDNGFTAAITLDTSITQKK